MRRATITRLSVAAVGGLLLAGVAGAAAAEELIGDSNDVDVTVQIAQLHEPGILALSVADSSTVLAENGSTAAVRRFTGTLPTVTVTDTRTAGEIPDGAFWYVNGTASSLVGDTGQPEIAADHLGWSPHLLTPNAGEVSEGPQVDTVLDAPPNNVGLEGAELLAMAESSEEAVGVWQAAADLVLKVPVTVAPGTYTSVVTLSLFE